MQRPAQQSLSGRHWPERVNGFFCNFLAQPLAIGHVEPPVYSEVDAAMIVLPDGVGQGKTLLPHWTNYAGIISRYSIEFVRHEIFDVNLVQWLAYQAGECLETGATEGCMTGRIGREI